jgi:predicted TIM-barrel fold metal-dependent hydrolase
VNIPNNPTEYRKFMEEREHKNDLALHRLRDWFWRHSKELNLLPDFVTLDVMFDHLGKPADITVGDLRGIWDELDRLREETRRVVAATGYSQHPW